MYTDRLSRSASRTRPFQNVSFALFGLGDRAYGSMFCAAARKFGARMLQLGARSVCDVGYGDDGTVGGGVLYDLDVWLHESLLALKVFSRTRITTTVVEATHRQSQPSSLASVAWHRVVPEKCPNDESYTQHGEQSLVEYESFFNSLAPPTAYNHPGVRTAKVVANQRLTDSQWSQDTRHLVLNVESDDIQDHAQVLYQAGDICTILPSNSMENVEALLEVLPQSIRNIADCKLQISCLCTEAFPWPQQCTIRGWLTYCADIQALPEREDLRELSAYCHDPEQAEKLISLSEPSASALYVDYVLRERRTWRDVLHDFDSAELSLENLMKLLPPLRPRHFSIASASSADTIELCVAVVEGKTPLGRTYRGLCSSYLAGCEEGELVRIWLKPGSFRLPMAVRPSTYQYETPILCIGAGTGIAPLRSLVRERERQRPPEFSSASLNHRDTRLIFGCRKETMDFYYRDEWEALQHTNRLQLWTSFSQDQWHKIYVQQRMTEQKGMIIDHIITQRGAVYVAGGAKMALSVKEELVEILSEVLGGAKQAQMFLKQMQKEGKYALEAWT